MTPYEAYFQHPCGFANSHRQQFADVGRADLSDALAFIHESWYDVARGDLPQFAREIARCRRDSGRLPVLCLDTNPYPISEISAALDAVIDPDQYMLLSPYLDHLEHQRPNLAYWPYFLINTQRLPNYQRDRTTRAIQPRQQRISFLSRVTRYHRLRLWSEIRDYTRAADVVVINRLAEAMLDITAPPNTPGLAALLEGLPWSNDPSWFESEQRLHEDQHSNHHAAYSAFLNITGETAYLPGNVFVTEKTWKAYRSGCLVLDFGSPGTAHHLDRLGFRTWQPLDWVDHDLDARIASIARLFRSDDVETLYLDHLDDIKHNCALAEDPFLIQRLASDAVHKIQKLIAKRYGL